MTALRVLATDGVPFGGLPLLGGPKTGALDARADLSGITLAVGLRLVGGIAYRRELRMKHSEGSNLIYIPVEQPMHHMPMDGRVHDHTAIRSFFVSMMVRPDLLQPFERRLSLPQRRGGHKIGAVVRNSVDDLDAIYRANHGNPKTNYTGHSHFRPIFWPQRSSRPLLWPKTHMKSSLLRTSARC